jgi:hypothetical protein
VSSEGDDFQTWNHLEVTQISGRNTVAKLQGRDADQQVCQSKADTHRRVLPVDLSGTQSHRNRHRMHWHSRRQFIEKLPTHGLSFRRVGAGGAVRQLDQRHNRERHVFTSCALGDFTEGLPRIAALALCGDKHA